MQALQITPGDSVATLIEPVAAGEPVTVGDRTIVALGDIPRGHKVALAALAAGADVIKYGVAIGHATQPIAVGAHVHTHNLATNLTGTLDYRYRPLPAAREARACGLPTFQGYRRGDGRVATRNEIWVLPTVGCVGRTAQRIAAISAERHAGAVDGVLAFAHPFGCSQLGDDLSATRAILADLACHPNAGGVLIVGLGCESNQLDALLAEIPVERRAAVRTLIAQLSEDEVDEGVALVDDLVAGIGGATRGPVPFGELVLGVKCGGSDGFSGLTANPLVGRVTDRLTGAGGAAILTEIPEIFGAERLLMDRAADEAVFDATVELVNDFKRYFLDHGEPVSENPSPGNLAGGITTLEEKSLGAVQKGGRATVTDVRRYGERVRRPGLTLLEAPGNDAVSCTALTAAGATLILFTTGRGTPLGFPAPTMKIATNHALATRKPGWIDFDAGRVLDEGFDAAEAALIDAIVAAASGTPTAAERNGEREIALWKRGVTL
jgi:altronate hydrolase